MIRPQTDPLAGLLGGGGGMGGPAAGGLGGPQPAPAAPPEEEAAGSEDPVDLMKQALDLVRRALAVEKDEEDVLMLEKTTTQIQQYIANDQKMVDTAMGTGPGHKALRKLQG